MNPGYANVRRQGDGVLKALGSEGAGIHIEGRGGRKWLVMSDPPSPLTPSRLLNSSFLCSTHSLAPYSRSDLHFEDI